MASGGTGDVLTGLIGSFLAQGLPPWNASLCAVWLHGAMGDLAEEMVGILSLTASDLIDALPEVLDTIGYDPLV